MVFAEAKTHAKTYFRLFFIPRAKARGYKALTPTELSMNLSFCVN